MEKRKATTRFQKRRTLRLTAEEDERIALQAVTAGTSVSEYMRRLFFGGRPIIAKTDDQTIRELRRLGGLLKHHFDVVKRTGNTGTLSELDATLRAIRRAIEALSERR
ncbi:plasmid mobilization protein [Desulfovibrio sp. SGI.169]|uniref:plasmid mobilization protein n=1 Tax=Desulfovibrio sp. SGI.169 TaxID=3420561 RepID=UPI003D07F174